MNKKFDLNVLEAYARSLSSKQVNMLYENKLHKKYNKESVVNEGIPSGSFKMYVTEEMLNENKTTVAQLLKQCGNKSIDVKKHVGGGYTFYTKNSTAYSRFIGNMVDEGYKINSDEVDYRFRSLLD